MNKEEPSTVWSQGPQKFMQKSVDLWAQSQEVIMENPPIAGAEDLHNNYTERFYYL